MAFIDRLIVARFISMYMYVRTYINLSFFANYN